MDTLTSLEREALDALLQAITQLAKADRKTGVAQECVVSIAGLADNTGDGTDLVNLCTAYATLKWAAINLP